MSFNFYIPNRNLNFIYSEFTITSCTYTIINQQLSRIWLRKDTEVPLKQINNLTNSKLIEAFKNNEKHPATKRSIEDLRESSRS
jgi:hypothetical protein